MPLHTSSSPQVPQRQTLAESTAQILVNQIDSGRWRESLPGERILCNELQISRPTLRQALKILEREGRVDVSQGKRRNIVRGNSTRIPTPLNNMITLLSPLPFQSLPRQPLLWVSEVRSYLNKHDCLLQFKHSRALSSNNPESALNKLAHNTPSALWILLLCPPPVQKWFLSHHIPCLVAGSCAPDITLPSVDIDFHAACYHAAGVFRRKGHSQLALVIPANDSPGDAESDAGFHEGLTSGPAPITLRHDGTPENIIQQIEKSLRLKNPPTGFLVARSAHVLTVLTFLIHRGMKIPEQTAVISRDNDIFLNFVIPRIARYNSSPEKFAKQLSNIAVKMIHSGTIPDHPIRLMPTFLPGETG